MLLPALHGFCMALAGPFLSSEARRRLAIGMLACVLVLSKLFEARIYSMGSLFLGLTPASLDAPQAPVSLQTFDLVGFALGVALLLGLELLRKWTAQQIAAKVFPDKRPVT